MTIALTIQTLAIQRKAHGLQGPRKFTLYGKGTSQRSDARKARIGEVTRVG